MTPEQRASWAQQLLNNPLFEETLSEMEKSTIAEIAYAPAADHDTRQALAAELRVIWKFREALKSISTPVSMPRVKSIA